MFNFRKTFIHNKSGGHHITTPTSADLISPNEFLTFFMFNPKNAIILFTCLMFEHDQRHSNIDIQMIQKYLLIHGNNVAHERHLMFIRTNKRTRRKTHIFENKMTVDSFAMVPDAEIS